MSNLSSNNSFWQYLANWLAIKDEPIMPETFYAPTVVSNEISMPNKIQQPPDDVFERFKNDVDQLSRNPTCNVAISQATACDVLLQLQLAEIIPGNDPAYRQASVEFAKQLQELLAAEFRKEQADLKHQEGELLREINRLESVVEAKRSRRTYLEEISEKLGLKVNNFDQEPLPSPNQRTS